MDDVDSGRSRRSGMPASALDGPMHATPSTGGRKKKRKFEAATIAKGPIDPNDATRTVVTYERKTPPRVSHPDRPARKLAVKVGGSSGSGGDAKSKNIWYHKTPGQNHQRVKATTRCVFARDAGKTKAIDSAYFCLHFAHGSCAAGYDCSFKHGIPIDSDEKQLELTKDIFGRERHATDHSAMGGVGSFERHNTTLYVNGLVMPSKEQGWLGVQQTVVNQFGEWGDIKSIRILAAKMCVFVIYYLRASAEFAKEAMKDQNMGNGEWLNVRWATDDPNPQVAAEEQSKRLATMQQAVLDQYAAEQARYEQLVSVEGFPTYAPSTATANDWAAIAPTFDGTESSSATDGSSTETKDSSTTATVRRVVRNRDDDSDQHLPASLLPATALGSATGGLSSTPIDTTSTSVASSSWPTWKPNGSAEPIVVAAEAAAADASRAAKNKKTILTSGRHVSASEWPSGVPMPAVFNATEIVIPSTVAAREETLSSAPSPQYYSAAHASYAPSTLADRLRSLTSLPAPTVAGAMSSSAAAKKPATSALAGLAAYDSDDE